MAHIHLVVLLGMKTVRAVKMEVTNCDHDFQLIIVHAFIDSFILELFSTVFHIQLQFYYVNVL